MTPLKIKFKIWYLKIKGYFNSTKSSNSFKNVYLAKGVQLFGIKNIEIGENSSIGENTTLVVNDRTSKKIKLIIGKNTYIGRNNFLSVGKQIKIGSYCIFGNNCALISSDHRFESPLVPYATSGFTTNKEIFVGTNCWFGINVTVIGNVNIGHGSIIGANSLVHKDIPPFSLAVGNPAKIIKRFDFDQQKWINGNVVNDSIFLDEKIYLEAIKKFGDLSIAYHSSSSQFGNIM